jgi:hypothetical protein
MAYLVAVLVPVLWLGFVLAISFMEAPLKFRAPHTSRLAALSIGQVVFRALTRVELALLAVLIAALAVAAWPAGARAWLYTLAGVVAVQQLWLLPRLDRRVTAVLAGRDVPPDPLVHRLYAAAEGLKLVLLPGLCWSLARYLTPLAGD